MTGIIRVHAAGDPEVLQKRKSYRYQAVDVFTRTPLEGNTLAVFPDAAELDAVTMQRIARELSLSETVFIVPSGRPDCVARLRIFTPRKELDFAGSPTIGAGAVLMQLGHVRAATEVFSVEENVGAVPISVDRSDSMLWLRTPPVTDGPVIDKSEAAMLMALSPDELADATPQILSAGNPTLFIALRSKAAVDDAALDGTRWAAIRSRYHPDPMCALVFCPTTEGAYSRVFAPDYGVAEDPGTGSSTGPLAFYMMRRGMTPARGGSRFVSEQGVQMGRRSVLHVRLHGEGGKDGVDVGGFVTKVIDGELLL
jgi:trans-2,3-dihydro-3-hydroxyanthranilate isomerase